MSRPLIFRWSEVASLIEALAEEDAALSARVKEIAAWIQRRFVDRSNAARTRCPSLAGAIAQDDVWLLFDLGNFDSRAIGDVSSLWSSSFKGVEETSGGSTVAAALIIIFLQPENRARIQILKDELKRDFVSQGFLIGTFNPEERNEPYDSELDEPPKSPESVIAIRRLLPVDARFLTHSDEFLELHRRQFDI